MSCRKPGSQHPLPSIHPQRLSTTHTRVYFANSFGRGETLPGVFFFLPQFEDIACGSTSGVWWRICTRRIGPMECQSGCPAGQLNDFDHLPCMPRSPGVRARSVFILLAPLNHLAPLPALAPFVPVAPLNVLALHHRQAGQLERLRRFALFCLTVKQTKFPTIFSSVYSTMTCRDLASHGVVSVCCLFALRFGFVNIKDVGHFCSHI